MSQHLSTIATIYTSLLKLHNGSGIPVTLRARSLIGTTQDDPFDGWVEEEITKCLGSDFDVYHSGKLQTPDIVIRRRSNGSIIGLEVKKITQKDNGSDARGLTLDYNSCLPCGSTLVKVGSDTLIVPCFYLFALLNKDNTSVVTLILMDGDFLNFDFDLHKESKVANYTEYNHGPYGEGSIRHRRMYTYPNPLNSKIDCFHLRYLLVAKRYDLAQSGESVNITDQVTRSDIHGNNFHYVLRDDFSDKPGNSTSTIRELAGVFDSCKERVAKDRSPSIVTIPGQ